MAIQAGVARACITPPLDIPQGIWAAQKHVRAEGIDIDLYATVLVLSDDELRVALIDLDLCFLRDQQASEIRQAVSSATGIAQENILPLCSHTHACPVSFDSYQGEGADRVHSYVQMLPHWVAGAAVQAAKCVRPVLVAAGQGSCNIGVNRDLRISDGRFIVGCNPAGYFDPTVSVLRLDLVEGGPLVCILNYGCHPTVLGPGNRLVSPDYPGTTRRVVEDACGATCLFLQGAAGNIGPIETFVSDVSVARRLGTILGLEAARVFWTLSTRRTEKHLRGVIASGAPLADYEERPLEIPDPHLKFARTFLELPIRSPLSDLYEKAPERLAEWQARLSHLLEEHAQPADIAVATQRVTRFQLWSKRRDDYRTRTTLPVETCALRLGDTALAAMEGEPYSEIGSAVRSRSPFPQRTLFAGYLGGEKMYVPTADLYRHPSPPFEVEISPYGPEAAEICIEHMARLLSSVE